MSVYFMGEKVGYEEYVWEDTGQGYLLSVKGRMTKPVAIEVERLKIEMDRSFIPLRYSFRGSLGGVQQEISSVLSEGSVVNTILVDRQEQSLRSQIKRDAFLLPNPFYSPYLVIAKKYGCTMGEKKNLSAYIIPQLETSFTLEPSEEDPCLLLLQINGIQMELVTNEFGQLKILQIPAQNIRVTNNISSFN
ncbi:MAG: hypothetical protein MUP98_03795 [Candidatus Aminicenantes bacterium]|nr:hypothetical protein [Candidatus Aminicenantes bacterium]